VNARHRTQRPHVGRGFAALLALALLWAQALGLAHRVLHMPGAALAVASAAGHDDALRHAPQSAECRLFDQLAAGDGVVAASPTGVEALAPVAAPSEPRALPAGSAPLGYRARAPPLLA
jgi:hypothetical protein